MKKELVFGLLVGIFLGLVPFVIAQDPVDPGCTNGDCPEDPGCSNGDCPQDPGCTNGDCPQDPGCSNGDCPVTFNDHYTACGGFVEVDAPGVMENDHGYYANPDPTNVVYTVKKTHRPTYGDVTLELDGSFTYQYTYTGEPKTSDAFTYGIYRNDVFVNEEYVFISLQLADADGDGTSDCNDQCPNDAAKVEPEVCGCGVADTDTDGDGTPDCTDGCPTDNSKTAPGVCGCGVSDTDTDGDTTPDCNDQCPSDPLKIIPDECGCGVADTDTDNDGTPDCNDQCPADPDKTAPDDCGCGVADTDTDGDGTSDCTDGCPDDPDKIEPGTLGCGVAETDTTDDICAYIQSLPDTAFKNDATNRKDEFCTKLAEIDDMIASGQYLPAYNKLQNDIRSKVDSDHPNAGWIIDLSAQNVLCNKIDTVLNALYPLI